MRANHYRGRNQIVWYKRLESVWASSLKINNRIKLLNSQIQGCCSGCNLTFRPSEQPERRKEVAIGSYHGRLCCLSEQQVWASTYWLGRGRLHGGETSKQQPRDGLQRALLTGARPLPPGHRTAPPDHSEAGPRRVAAANRSSLEQVTVEKGNTSCVWPRIYRISTNFAQGNQNKSYARCSTLVLVSRQTHNYVPFVPPLCI